MYASILKGAIATNHCKADCTCWEGYKRVPGTKPCAPGSCEKIKKDDLKLGSVVNPVLDL